MRIALAGTGKLGVEILKGVLASRHEVVAVLQNGRLARGYRRRLIPALAKVFGRRSTVPGVAGAHGVPVLWIDRMTEEELAPLRVLDIDLLLVGGFGIILKKPILEIPRVGCLNAHSSLLPRHRGPNPFTAAILASEVETGVTYHVIDEGIDTGDIVEQVKAPLDPHQTAGEIYVITSELAGKHVATVLDRIEREGLRGEAQDGALATYEKNLKPEETYVDWQQPAEVIDRLVRACSPFMFARFRRGATTVTLLRTRPDSAPANAEPGTVLQIRPAVRVATGQGTITVLGAYSVWPLPWLWPAPWNRPVVGERLE